MFQIHKLHEGASLHRERVCCKVEVSANRQYQLFIVINERLNILCMLAKYNNNYYVARLFIMLLFIRLFIRLFYYYIINLLCC